MTDMNFAGLIMRIIAVVVLLGWFVLDYQIIRHNKKTIASQAELLVIKDQQIEALKREAAALSEHLELLKGPPFVIEGNTFHDMEPKR